jgi:hypothetical protein
MGRTLIFVKLRHEPGMRAIVYGRVTGGGPAMTSERGLLPQRMRQQEPKPDEQGDLMVESEDDDYPEDVSDPDGQPGAECSNYIPRYATT